MQPYSIAVAIWWMGLWYFFAQMAGNKNGLLVPHTTTDQGEFNWSIMIHTCFFFHFFQCFKSLIYIWLSLVFFILWLFAKFVCCGVACHRYLYLYFSKTWSITWFCNLNFKLKLLNQSLRLTARFWYDLVVEMEYPVGELGMY